MVNRMIILSIRPVYAAKIFEGLKVVELRRKRPQHLQKGALGLIYVSSPVRSLAGAFLVADIIEGPLTNLWKMVRDKAGVTYSEFKEYYAEVSVGTGIFFNKVWRFQEPLSLHDLRRESIDFLPPQTFRYAKSIELATPRIAKLLSGIGYKTHFTNRE